MLAITLASAGMGSSAQQSTTGPLGDYGDAPDELSAGYTRANPQMIGSFPSTFSAASDPSYILHRFPQERVYLGQTVTVEDNALLVDRDLDDGWVPGSFLTCSRARFSVHVTVPREATAGPIYLNVLFDWDHDGRWADFSTCTTTTQRDQQAAEEWAVRNLPLHQQPYSLTPGFSGTIDLPEIITGPLEGELWVRVTISTEPVDERVFVPIVFGGHGWNGQGDFLYGETEDYFSCLLVSSDRPLPGCPRPLSDQPPIDPPPSTSQNNAPIANDDTAVLSEGASAVIEVLSNDSDPDNDSVSIVDVTQPAHGSVTINPDGTVTYIPEQGFLGTDSFSYTICDTSGLCDSATVTITVAVNAQPINNPPAAEDDTVTTDEDSPVTIDIIANDTDVDGVVDPSTVTIIAGPTNGSVTVNADGSVTYTPAPDFYGTDTFTYQVCDNGSPVLCDTATVAVTVTPVNDPPQLTDISDETINEGQTLTVRVTCADLDSPSVTITASNLPPGATFTDHGNGTGTLTYTPGFDTVQHPSSQIVFSNLSITCSDGSATDTDTFNLTVHDVNRAPDAVDDSVTTEEDTPVTINVLANDSDPDGDPLTITNNTQPAKGTVSCTATQCTYMPNANFFGTDTFSYTLSDGNGSTDTATVTITINPVNDPPVASSQSISTPEDTPVNLTLTCSDVDGDSLTFGIVDSPSSGSLSGTPPNVTYAPNANFNGSDSFTFKCNDGQLDSNTATVSIAVTPINDAPQLAAIPDQTVTEGQTLTVNVSCTDVDGDTLTLNTANLPPGAAFTDNGNGTGTLSYTPDFDTVQHPATQKTFSGVQINCSDGSLTDTKNFKITVNDVNRAPEAFPQSVTTPEDTPLGITLTASDPDGDPITFSLMSSPGNGILSGFNPNTGTVTYTPNGNYNGPDSFTFRVNDGSLNSNIATVSITVTAVNDPPTLTPIPSQSVSEGQTLTLLVSCTDIDGLSLTLTSSNLPPGATFADNGDGTGTLTYTPAFDTVQHPNEQIIFSNISITCNDGSATDTDTFNITVNDVNRNPLANDDTASTDEDTPVVIDVRANDTDPDGDTPIIISNTQGVNGTVVCTTTCIYTPNLNFNGTDTFTYTISDGKGGTDIATVTVTVNDNDQDDDGIPDDHDNCPNDPEDHDGDHDDEGCPENEEPQADNLELTTPQDTPVSGTLPVRDDDPGDIVTCTLTQPASNGTATVNPDCTFTYTPNPGFTGTDRFDYQVTDGQASDEGHVAITVTSESTWDKSSLTFTGAGKNCEGKTVFATVKNVGSPMQGPTTWELYYSASGNPQKNGVLIATGTIPALASDEEFTIFMSVTQKGNYKFRAIQRPGHPGKGDLWSDTITFDCD